MRSHIFCSGLPLFFLLAALSGAEESTNFLPRVESSDRQFVAIFASNGKIKITGSNGVLVRRLDHCSPLAGIFSADNSLFCAAGRCLGGYGSVKVWRVSDGTLLCKLDNEIAEVPRLSFSPDGRLLACTAGPTRINVWNIPEQRLKWSTSLKRGITSLRFDQNGTRLTVECTDKSIHEVLVQNGQAVPAPRANSPARGEAVVGCK